MLLLYAKASGQTSSLIPQRRAPRHQCTSISQPGFFIISLVWAAYRKSHLAFGCFYSELRYTTTRNLEDENELKHAKGNEDYSAREL